MTVHITSLFSVGAEKRVMYKETKVITGNGTRLIDVRGLFTRIVICDQMNRFTDVEFAEYVCCRMETVLRVRGTNLRSFIKRDAELYIR